MYAVSQEDIRLLTQKEKIIYTKIEVKNKNLATLEEVSGVCTEFSYDISSDSGIRRTANLTCFIKDEKYMARSAGLFWIDKIIYVEVGYYNIRLKKIHYYPVGYFLITDNGYQYDATNRTISLSLVDMMAWFNGERNGHLTGSKIAVYRYGNHPVDWYTQFNDEGVPYECDDDGNKISDNLIKPNLIRDVVVDIVSDWGKWNKYRVGDIGDTLDGVYTPYEIPHDLEYGAGSTIFDILNEIRELYPNWEFFFDTDGTFVYQEIPTCIDDPIALDDNILRDAVISEPFSNSFTTIANMHEVFGKCYETDYFLTESSGSRSAINGNLSITDFTYQSGKLYGFVCPADNAEGATLKINSLNAFPIVKAKNFSGDVIPIPAGEMVAGKSYVVKCDKVSKDNFQFLFQGQYQIWAIDTLWRTEPSNEIKQQYIQDYGCDNISFTVFPENPFTIDKVGLIIAETIEDDRIYTDQLCIERAQFENYNTTILCDTVNMDCLSVPWLDVNQKVSHKLDLDGEEKQYIVKSISNNVMEGTMSLSMTYFYDYYPYRETYNSSKN